MFKSKVAILIHGCHLQADGWETIVWGNPRKGIYGRAAKGLVQADLHNADLIIWGTGGSQKDGMKESQYTFHYAVSHAQDLPTYRGFDVYQIEAMLKARSHLDLETQNTTEEIMAALLECHKRGIMELILVSSPTHIARCLQEATKVLAETPSQTLVYATASDTCFAGSIPGDVVIVEPPHRGDLPKWQTHRYVRAMFQVMREGPDTFRRFLDQFGQLLHDFGVNVTWKPLP